MLNNKQSYNTNQIIWYINIIKLYLDIFPIFLKFGLNVSFCNICLNTIFDQKDPIIPPPPRSDERGPPPHLWFKASLTLYHLITAVIQNLFQKPRTTFD